MADNLNLRRTRGEPQTLPGTSPRGNWDSAQRRGNSPQNRARAVRVIDLDACPRGYDPAVWDVTMYFIQAAESYGVELATGKLLVYAHLCRRIMQVKGMTRPWPFWAALVKMMIDEFWAEEVFLAREAYAVDQFCGVETFTMLLDWALFRSRERPVLVAVPAGPNEATLARRDKRKAQLDLLARPDATAVVMGKVRDYLARRSA